VHAQECVEIMLKNSLKFRARVLIEDKWIVYEIKSTSLNGKSIPMSSNGKTYQTLSGNNRRYGINFEMILRFPFIEL